MARKSASENEGGKVRHDISLRRRLAAVTLAASGLLLTSTAAPGAAAFAAASPTRPELAAMLLPVRALPTGWHATTVSSGSGIGCLSHLLEPNGLRQLASVQASFAAEAKSPALTEKLATYAAGPAAAFAKVRVELANCRHFTGTVDHQAVTGTLNPMPLAHLGAQSAAYAVAVRVGSNTVHEDVVIVHKAAIVLGLAEASTRPIAGAQFLRFARLAAARVR